MNYIVILQYILTISSFQITARWKLVAQFVFLQCIITTTRAITISLTILPDIVEYNYCKQRPDNFFQVLSYMIQYGTCGEYMFSGHTATSFLTYLFVAKHSKWKWNKWVVGILTDTVIVFLLLQRWHYTVDCLVAVIIVWLLFTVYKWNEKKYKYWFYFSELEALTVPLRTHRKLDLEKPGYYFK